MRWGLLRFPTPRVVFCFIFRGDTLPSSWGVLRAAYGHGWCPLICPRSTPRRLWRRTFCLSTRLVSQARLRVNEGPNASESHRLKLCPIRPHPPPLVSVYPRPLPHASPTPYRERPCSLLPCLTRVSFSFWCRRVMGAMFCYQQCPGVPDGLGERMAECEEVQQYERSAALAVFHGDLGAAIKVPGRLPLCLPAVLFCSFLISKCDAWRLES